MRGRGDATTRRVLCAEARGLRDASVDAAHSATTKERQLDSFRYTNRSCLDERVEAGSSAVACCAFAKCVWY